MTDTIPAPETKLIRWSAVIYYRTEQGVIDVQHDMEEIHELQDIVENGPHWDTIHLITIVRTDGADRKLTVEEAERL